MGEFTFAECEDLVERATKQPDSPLEALMELMSIGEVPPYIEGLRQLRAGIAKVREMFEPCGCGDPACIDTPAHRDHLNETVHPPISGCTGGRGGATAGNRPVCLPIPELPVFGLPA